MNTHRLKLSMVRQVSKTGSWYISKHILSLVKEEILEVAAAFPEHARDIQADNALSTYDNCLDLFVIAGEPDRIELIVWNGNAFDGHPTTKRACYTLIGEWWKSDMLLDMVSATFEQHCYMMAMEEEKREKVARLQKRAEQIGIQKLTELAQRAAEQNNIKEGTDACPEQS